MIRERRVTDGATDWVYTVDETLAARRFAKRRGWLQTSFFGDLCIVLIPVNDEADRLEFELVCS